MSEVKIFSAKDFRKIDIKNSTLLDVREPGEVIVHPVDGAIQIPFFELSKKIDSIPKDKPVYVFCSTGDRSEQVAEILADRDFEVYNIEGGLDAVPKALHVDAKGLKCPGPIVKVDETIKKALIGDEIQVEADEKAFFSDVEVWCQRTGNELKSLTEKDGVIYATIVKKESPVPEKREFEHGKTFVVFSGDLDKAIASFIMANGAAAMGRSVTMFFTFAFRKNSLSDSQVRIVLAVTPTFFANFSCVKWRSSRKTVSDFFFMLQNLLSTIYGISMCFRKSSSTTSCRHYTSPYWGCQPYFRHFVKFI